MIRHADAQHGGCAQRAGESERVEKWQDAQQPIIRGKSEDLSDLLDIGDNVVMREHHPFRITRTSAREDDRG